MVIRMAAPIWVGGVAHLKQRTPKDLLECMIGQTISLPIDDKFRKVTVGEFVQISLRTREPNDAKRRHAIADAYLRQLWAKLRRQMKEAPAPEAIKWPTAVAQFSADAEQALNSLGVPNTDANRARVISEAASIFDEINGRLGYQFLGSPLVPNGSGVKTNLAGPSASKITVAELWTRWSTDRRRLEAVAESTIDRYKPSLMSLAAFVGDRDVTTLSGDDIYNWAVGRRDKDGLLASVVNGNDLVAASSVFEWARSRQGGKLVFANPVKGVRLDEKRRRPTRERTLREAEVKRILTLANKVQSSKRNPSSSRAQRWCPWLCAHSGARIAEVTHLKAEDIWKEGDSWVMHLTHTKTGEPRTVPLHSQLVEEGFIEAVQRMGSGPLFYDEARHSKHAKTSPGELRAQKIAAWIRDAADLDPAVDPNHGWRHTWKTRAIAAGIEARLRDEITGHAVTEVARKYETPSLSMLVEAIKKFPKYNV